MLRKRRCPVCGRRFMPVKQAGDRQRTCSDPGCQRQRHAQSCADWRERNRSFDREERVRRKFFKDGEPSVLNLNDLASRINWDQVRDSVGLEVAVLLREIVKNGNKPRKTQ
jgi:hypothetical protein